VNRDDDRDDQSLIFRRARVECLAEFHDVHAVLPESRADGRSRCGLPCWNLEFDVARYFLCHWLSLLRRSAAGLFLARVVSIDLEKIQFDRSGASEDRDHD